MDAIHAIKTAKKMGAYVIALDSDKNAEGLQYANKSYIVDIKDYNQIYSILDEYRPQIVLPAPIGRYLTSIGAVNDHYNLPGVSLQAATACTDKYVFHMMLHEQEKRQAVQILIKAADTEQSTAVNTLNYPIVAKPRYGSGSRSVRIYTNSIDFQKNFLAHRPLSEDFVVESCIQGMEYGVDAAMIQGELYLVLLREKLQTPAPYCQCVGYYSVPETDATKKLFHNVRKIIFEACKILAINDCLLHADIIDHDGEAFLIEISARPSGHNLHNLFTPLATGVDMIAEYLHFALPQLGRPYSFTPVTTKNMLIHFFDFAHCRVKQVPDVQKIKSRYSVRKYSCSLRKGMLLGPVKDGHSLMNRGYYIVEGTNRNQLELASKAIMSEFVLEDI